ncbi:hypothetical protein QJQ45_030107, partial [Haematococcus lacustris]
MLNALVPVAPEQQWAVKFTREVTAQRRAAEAAGPIEIGAQAGVIAAEAQAQAVAGAQLHQLQADLQHRELQLAHNQRMQQLQQQLQDLQRSELQRKEQQLADLVAQQRAALLQWEHQLTQRQHQLQQQQVDLSRREQDLTERKFQSLQQELKAQQVAEEQQQQTDLLLNKQQMEKQPLAYLQAISNNHPLPDPSPCSRTRLDEYQAAAAAIAAAAVGAVLRAAVEAEGQGQQDGWARATRGNRDKAMGRGRGNPTPAISSPPCPEHALSPRLVWDLRSHRQQQQQQPQPLSTSPQAWQRRLQPLLDEFQQYPVEEGSELLDRLQQHRRMRSVVSLATGVVPPTPDQVLGGIKVDSLRPVLAGIKPAPGGQRTTNQQPFNTALIMTMGRGIEQHGIKRTARQLGITPHAVKRARRSHLSNLAAGAAADWAAAPLQRGRRCLSQEQLEYVRSFFEDHSSPSPMYKDVRRYYVRMTAGSSKKSEVRMSRRYVDRSLKKLYLEYERECPKTLKVGSTTFEMLRPPWVKRITAAHKQVCVCIPCETCELATVQTTLGGLVADLNDLMQKQLWHQYLAKHQRATFRAHCAAVQNTPGLVVVSCDWSEKLTIHQDIACQGAYWKQRTMSVFVACAHYQDMAGNYREESVFVSADKCDQSAEASTTALVQVIECLLQGRRHPDGILGVASNPDGVGDGRDDGEGWVGKMDMRQLCLWSDGCASQFKGAKAIMLHWHLANRTSRVDDITRTLAALTTSVALLLSSASHAAAMDAPAATRPSIEAPEAVYFGNGCFWGRQFDFVSAEKALGRGPEQISAVVGYAGGRQTGPDGKVCYYLADPRLPAASRHGPDAASPQTVYEKLGHAEVVKVQLSPEAQQQQQEFRRFADTYFKQFRRTADGRMQRLVRPGR